MLSRITIQMRTVLGTWRYGESLPESPGCPQTLPRPQQDYKAGQRNQGLWKYLPKSIPGLSTVGPCTRVYSGPGELEEFMKLINPILLGVEETTTSKAEWSLKLHHSP